MIKNYFFPSFQSYKKASYFLFFGIFFGILIRLGMFLFVELNFLFGDTATYIQGSTNILEYGTFGVQNLPTVYRPPLYPFFMASIFFVLGESFFSVQVIQIFLSLISALLLTRILAIHYPKASPWMFLLMIISPFESIYSVALLSENLTSFLLVISAFFIFTDDRPFKWILAGIALGLACLTRDIYLLMGFFICFFWLVFSQEDFKQKLFKTLLFISFILLTIAPWSARNFYHTGDFIPVSEGRMGYGLWFGTWAKDGDYSKSYIGRTVIFPPEAPLSEEERLYIEKSLEEGAGIDQFETFFLEKALERMKETPLEVLKTYIVRSPLLWLGTRFDIFVLNKNFFPRESVSWYLLKSFLYGINLCFLLLAIFGIYLMFKKRNCLLFLTLPLLYTAVIYMPFTAYENRYSQPVYPFILLFAAIALPIIFKRINFRRYN